MALPEGQRNPRILLIDDSGDYLGMISYRLQAKGCRVMTALNCEGAMKIIEAAPLDMVFLDMQMPEVDGAETLQRIRKIHKDLPVIVVTAFPDGEMVDRAKIYGISGIFPKDGDFETLVQVMEKALKK